MLLLLYVLSCIWLTIDAQWAMKLTKYMCCKIRISKGTDILSPTYSMREHSAYESLNFY